MYPATNSTSPIIWNVKLPFLVELTLSPKLQIKRQHKQCFSCPMSSVKVLVTKSGGKKRYTLHEKPKLRSPSYDHLATFNVKFFKNYHSLCQININISSLHSSQLWWVSLWSCFTYRNFVLYAFLSIPALNKFTHICKHKIA